MDSIAPEQCFSTGNEVNFVSKSVCHSVGLTLKFSENPSALSFLKTRLLFSVPQAT